MTRRAGRLDPARRRPTPRGACTRAPLLAIARAVAMLAATACGSPSAQDSEPPIAGASRVGDSEWSFTLSATDEGSSLPQGIVSAEVEGGHGTVWPIGVFYAYGKSVTFHFAPDRGHHIGSVSVDGEVVSLAEQDSYTFTCTAERQLLVVSYVPDGETPASATITTEVPGGHGSVTPFSAQSVAAGARPAFTFIPDDGYEVRSIRIDGVDLQPDPPTRYVFLPVTRDHTLSVRFRPTD